MWKTRFSHLGIAGEVTRGERVGGCEGRGGWDGGQGAVWTPSPSCSSSSAGLLSCSLILTGPANPKDPAPQGGGAAGGAAWRITGRAGGRKTNKQKETEKANKIRDAQKKPFHFSQLDSESKPWWKVAGASSVIRQRSRQDENVIDGKGKEKKKEQFICTAKKRNVLGLVMSEMRGGGAERQENQRHEE